MVVVHYLVCCKYLQMLYFKGNHCNNVTDLGYMTERLVGYVLGPGEAGVNDRYLTEGWYRMKGYTLSRKPNKKCGSVVNWYMKGTFMLMFSSMAVSSQKAPLHINF